MGTLYNALNNISTNLSLAQKKIARTNIGYTENLFLSSNNSLLFNNDDSETGKILIASNTLHLDALSNDAIAFTSPSNNTYTLKHNTYTAVAADKPYRVGRDAFGHVVYDTNNELITADDINAATNYHWHGHLTHDGKIVGGTYDSSEGSAYITPSSNTALCLVDMSSYVLVESTIKFGTADDDIHYYLNPRGQWKKAYTLNPSNTMFTTDSSGYISISFAGSWLYINDSGISNGYTHPTYGTYSSESLYAFNPVAQNTTPVTGVTNIDYGHVFGMSSDSFKDKVKTLGISTVNTTYKFETGSSNGKIKITQIDKKQSGDVVKSPVEYSLGGVKSAAFYNVGNSAKQLPIVGSSLKQSSSTSIYPVVINDSKGTLTTTASPLGKMAECIVHTSTTSASYVVPFNTVDNTLSLNIDTDMFKINSDGALALKEDKLVLVDNLNSGRYFFYINAGEKYPKAVPIDAPVLSNEANVYYVDSPNNYTTFKTLFCTSRHITITNLVPDAWYEVSIHIPHLMLHCPYKNASYVMSIWAGFETPSISHGNLYLPEGQYYGDVSYAQISLVDIYTVQDFNLRYTDMTLPDGTLPIRGGIMVDALPASSVEEAFNSFSEVYTQWIHNPDYVQTWITLQRIVV